MRSNILLAGAAALVIASPALAETAKPKEGGGGPAKAERGGGGNGGGNAKAERGGGGPQRAEAPKMRGPERRMARAEQRAERPKEMRREDRKVERREMRDVREVRDDGRRDKAGKQDRMVEGNQGRQRDMMMAGSDQRGFGFACPPGLAAKNNGCLPPGQAKKRLGLAVPATLGAAMLPPLYRSWYPDDDGYSYRVEDGYVYRIDLDRNVVDGFFPLYDEWNGAYYVGAAYPQDYLGTYNVPVQYRSWYADGDDYYRYGDGAIYQVDRQGGLIESVVSLLAGDLALGQQLPASYDVYNVPYDYRDRYADSQDAWYRYNDGNIYQVDPTTRLVQAIVETLT